MKILFVTTSNAVFEGPNPHPTGVWLDEFTDPYMEFHNHGVEIVVASPKGGQMPIDPRTLPNDEQKVLWEPALAAASSTAVLSTIEADSFDAIFIPGGHGPMFDLPGDPHLKSLVEVFYTSGKIIAAVCHGPCGLVGATRADGKPIVEGITLTSYTYAEEVAAKLDTEVPFILEHRLRELGANFIPRENRADHVERDGQFFTGQNPWSSKSLAVSVMAALQKQFQPQLNIVGKALLSTRTVAEFPVNTFLENIAAAPNGALYVNSHYEGQVYKVVPGGAVTPFTKIDKCAGIAIDPSGNLIIAGAAGIHVVDPSGEIKDTIPTPDAVFLNGLCHLEASLYLVADSYCATIWQVDIDARTVEVWLQHPTLAHASDPFHPVPMFPGANGIHRHNDVVYISSTQQQKLLRVPLATRIPEVVMTNTNLDDFAIASDGSLYATTHIYDNLVRIDPIARTTTIVAEDLAGSTSAVAHNGKFYVTTNGGMSRPPAGGPQPARVVEVG